MRYLCVGDVHGHASALSAVIAAAERKGSVDALLVAGDLFFAGPEPLQTYRILCSRRSICVRGLTDRALVELTSEQLHRLANNEHTMQQAIEFDRVRKSLGELGLQWLKNQKNIEHLALEDGRLLALVHGSPLDPSEPITHDLSADEVAVLLADDPASVFVCAMTHVPFVHEVGERSVVNVGSVGESATKNAAHGTIIDSTVAGVVIDPIEVAL